jgi:hypothetical protein
MSFCWRFYYFEAGADQPYCSRRFFMRARMQRALAHFSRLGGDDILQIVPPVARCAPELCAKSVAPKT